MCNPLAALAVGAIGAGFQAVQQQKYVKKQQSAEQEWAAYQRQMRALENDRQEAMRKRAESARQGALDEMDPISQTERRETEEARLQEDYRPGTEQVDEANFADQLLSGQASAGSLFKDDFASRVVESSKSAQERIDALARLQSFGGSFGGLGTTNPIIFDDQGALINLQNEQRRGSLAAYNAEKAVDPIRYNPPSGGGLGGIFSSLLSKGAYGAGTMGV